MDSEFAKLTNGRIGFDPRSVSHVNIVDTYTKSGKHLNTVCTSPGGDVIWMEGRKPSKDICFVDYLKPHWERFNETNQI